MVEHLITDLIGHALSALNGLPAESQVLVTNLLTDAVNSELPFDTGTGEWEGGKDPCEKLVK